MHLVLLTFDATVFNRSSSRTPSASPPLSWSMPSIFRVSKLVLPNERLGVWENIFQVFLLKTFVENKFSETPGLRNCDRRARLTDDDGLVTIRAKTSFKSFPQCVLDLSNGCSFAVEFVRRCERFVERIIANVQL